MADKDCICHSGTIHSVTGEDIPKGTSVMTIKEGTGKDRHWVTIASPFQIHEKERPKVEVKIPESQQA